MLGIDDELLDKLVLVNTILVCSLGILNMLGLFSLLGDQLQNLCSNSTSYERAKNLKKSTILTLRQSLNETDSLLEGKDEEEKQTCFGNCCAMLS